MQLPNDRVIYLLDQYTEGLASQQEEKELFGWMETDGHEEVLKDYMLALYNEKQYESQNLINWEARFEKTLQEAKTKEAPVVKPFWWRRLWAVAAILIGLAGVGYVMLFSNGKQSIAKVKSQPQNRSNDINPAKGNAILTLADGSDIVLDSAANGKLQAANAQILKQDGKLVYTSATKITYNTLATEKGKTYQLSLADGTQVWLDGLSSIRFPTAFTKGDRVVEITGQVYFEVAHNAAQPFKVKVDDKTVEVLGTHFNVSARGKLLTTTLLEGSVKLTKLHSSKSLVITPGQQAVFTNDGSLMANSNADLEEVMAWKNGNFQFSGSSVEEIFEQLSQWYDIDVEYQDQISAKFVANISRDIPISKLLDLLEMTKKVHFKIEGKKITVMK